MPAARHAVVQFVRTILSDSVNHWHSCLRLAPLVFRRLRTCDGLPKVEHTATQLSDVHLVTAVVVRVWDRACRPHTPQTELTLIVRMRMNMYM